MLFFQRARISGRRPVRVFTRNNIFIIESGEEYFGLKINGRAGDSRVSSKRQLVLPRRGVKSVSTTR